MALTTPLSIRRAFAMLRLALSNTRLFDSKAYWDQRAKTYGRRSVLNLSHQDSEFDQVTATQKAILLPLFSAQLSGSERTVLDFGCGVGRFTEDLANAIHGSAVGIDISETLIQLAPRVPNVTFHSMADGRIPETFSGFDAIWICLVLGGIPEQSLRNLVRRLEELLKPGGLLFLAENTTCKPDGSYWHFRTANFYRFLFPSIDLDKLSTYTDAGEEITVFAGRKNNRLKAVFFCGHVSPYGIAHLEPVLNNFDVLAVVVATKKRWKQFREQLSRHSHPPVSIFEIVVNSYRRYRQRVGEWLRVDDLHAKCRHAGVPVVWTDDVNDPAFIRRVTGSSPDVTLTAAYPTIFTHELLKAARLGGINFHPSLLPRYRGAHPHFWTIAKGETEGGITAHCMTEKVDRGPIVAQIRFPIEGFYYSDYYRELVKQTPELVGEVRASLQSNRPPLVSTGESCFYRNDCEIDHRIFWDLMDVAAIHNLIRTEVAFCAFRGRLVKIHRAGLRMNEGHMTHGIVAEPGTVLDIEGSGIVLAAKGGCIAITAFRERTRLVPAARWAKRHRVQIGECFS